MRETTFNIVFAPYEDNIITRPLYLKLLRKFRAVEAPYRTSLRALLEFLLNTEPIAFVDLNLSDDTADMVAKITWVDGINLYDWYKMLKALIKKNAEEKAKKNKKVAPEDAEDNSTEKEKAFEEEIGKFAVDITGNAFVPSKTFTYKVMLGEGCRINIYEADTNAPVGSLAYDPETRLMTPSGKLPIGFFRFFHEWLTAVTD